MNNGYENPDMKKVNRLFIYAVECWVKTKLLILFLEFDIVTSYWEQWKYK